LDKHQKAKREDQRAQDGSGAEKPEIFIIGHKNPDTDSVCSSIAYAALKNALDPENRCVPKRLGRVSQETQFVLDYFRVKAPEYLNHAGTQIRDIEIRETEGVSGDITLKKAWEAIKENNIVTLPITSGRKLEGLVTVKDITKIYMDINDAGILAASRASYRNVLEALNGRLLVDCGETHFTRGKILVAAANPDVLENYIEEGDIIITSNRYETQLCAIELKAGCVIATTGAPIADTVLNFAREHGCAVISTPHDTYTAVRLINQSVPVSHVMKRDGLVTFGVDDYLEDVKKTMSKRRHRDFPVLDRHGNYRGMISRRFLLDTKKKRFILLDHNEKSQSADGIEEAEILEIIDHHRIGSMETMNPVYFRNQPLGCTATIIWQIYGEKGIAPAPETAGLLLAAIISDTLLFRSPTATDQDRQAAEDLAKRAEIDMEEFAGLMFKAGSNPGGKSPEEILYQDYKDFTLNETAFGIGQLSSAYEDELAEIKEKLLPLLPAACRDHKTDMIFFMLTDITGNRSEILFSGDEAGELIEKAFHRTGDLVRKPGDGRSLILEGVVSRKKQLAPAILAAIQG
jgi:manganese-dependent inorganic pyrophosphatase